MKRSIRLLVFFAGLVLLTAALVRAEALWETSLSTEGFDALRVTDTEAEKCSSVSVNVPADQLAAPDVDVFFFEALRLPDVLANEQKDAYASVEINETDLGKLQTSLFSCVESTCWRSVHVPATALNPGANTLRVCAKASEKVPFVEISPASRFGIYRLADFSDESSFSIEASANNPVIGQTVDITYHVTNNGHAQGEFSIERAVNTAVALDKPYYRVVQGQSFVQNAKLGPGQSQEFVHSIKVKALGDLTLPPAIIHWTQTLADGTILHLSRTSNQPTISIREPDRKLEGFAIHSEQTLATQKPVTIELQMKNTGHDPLYNLLVNFKGQEGLEIKNVSSNAIEELLPGQTAKISLVVLAANPGTLTLDCDAAFLDLGTSQNACPGTSLTFKDEGFSPLVIGSAILVVLSIGIYAYFYFVP